MKDMYVKSIKQYLSLKHGHYVGYAELEWCDFYRFDQISWNQWRFWICLVWKQFTTRSYIKIRKCQIGDDW